MRVHQSDPERPRVLASGWREGVWGLLSSQSPLGCFWVGGEVRPGRRPGLGPVQTE